MPKPTPPEKQADIEQLAREIREAVDAEIGELAANLATTDDAHWSAPHFRGAGTAVLTQRRHLPIAAC